MILLSSMSRNVLTWKVGKISLFTYHGLFSDYNEDSFQALGSCMQHVGLSIIS